MNELNLSHLLIALGGPSVAIMGIWKFWDKIKGSLTSGLVTQEQLEKHDKKLREYVLKEDSKNDAYIQTVDGKGQKNSEDVSALREAVEILKTIVIKGK
ncbi:hypothetical protein KAR91_82440 [Candidatus Pacearchaeota archaeon]|nr:hypothetical protein [Candidatus Pacearchaeota archaeon]